MEIELAADGVRAVIDTAAGARVASLEVCGLQLLVTRARDPLRWGCYPMAPWVGRIRDGKFGFRGKTYELPRTMPPHAIHGTTLDREWTREGDGRCAIDLGDAWPFRGRVTQEISLESDRLALRLELVAESEPFPASIGWHPWFLRRLTRGSPARLDFEAKSMYERDGAGLPTGRLGPVPPGPWDDCFTGVVSGPRIRWPGALVLRLSSTTDHWVVYDEPEHALCVEPQTGPPDALNIAPVLVSPGRPLVAEAVFAWRLE